MAEYILRAQGLELGEYRTLEDILKGDSELQKWHINALRIGQLYSMHVCVKPCVYEMPIDQQFQYVREYLETHGYGDNTVLRDFSKDFLVLKPQEANLFENIFKFNGDI